MASMLLMHAGVAGATGNVGVYVRLIDGAATLSQSDAVTVAVNMIVPTAPTINNTLWAASGAGALSDLSGISEAKYAANSTTHLTTGTADNALYVSETWDNGTVIRVQLPQAGTGIIPTRLILHTEQCGTSDCPGMCFGRRQWRRSGTGCTRRT